MSLYLLLLIISIAGPLALSFDRKVHFFTHWKSLFIGTLVSATIFIIWDIIFVIKGVWGFNPQYLLGANLFMLPIEEILFFIFIPYCCVFIHEVIKAYFPNWIASKEITSGITLFNISLITVLVFLNLDRSYTGIVGTSTIIITIIAFAFNRKLLSRFYITFLIMVIPFLIINGVLTGFGIDNEVVWYNNLENLGFRVVTIPVEDFAYAFSLVLLTLLVKQRVEWSNK